MKDLLIIADDFTGALDTGVQFASLGAVTRVIANPEYDFSQVDNNLQVLVIDVETRHMTPKEAYEVVYQTAKNALSAGFFNIYKKTDSALRGNIGSELAAVMDAAQVDTIAFIPALPRMNRCTRKGIHYINDVPVAESVFGQDPFEPVRFSAVADIIRESSEVPVVLHGIQDPVAFDNPGIQVYDSETEEDLMRIGSRLASDHLRLTAGCAGFGAVLANLLGLKGNCDKQVFLKEPNLFVACGSVNPVTIRQMQQAEENGFVHVHLTPTQKLESEWAESDQCKKVVNDWQKTARENHFILDVNDPEGTEETALYAKELHMGTEELRIRIARNLAVLIQKLLDAGLHATMLCTGGDTLLALMRQINVFEMTPVCEIAAGSVLTKFQYRGEMYDIISKSGGFGEPDLFCSLANLLNSENGELC